MFLNIYLFLFFGLGVFCCGLVFVNVVKCGEVYLFYDIVFVFVEVNVDKVYWVVFDDDGSMMVVYIDKWSIGYFVSIRDFVLYFRFDVISEYKFFDGKWI